MISNFYQYFIILHILYTFIFVFRSVHLLILYLPVPFELRLLDKKDIILAYFSVRAIINWDQCDPLLISLCLAELAGRLRRWTQVGCVPVAVRSHQRRQTGWWADHCLPQRLAAKKHHYWRAERNIYSRTKHEARPRDRPLGRLQIRRMYST